LFWWFSGIELKVDSDGNPVIFFFVFWVAFLEQALNPRQATVKNG
jgi:hypothetical protein